MHFFPIQELERLREWPDSPYFHKQVHHVQSWGPPTIFQEIHIWCTRGPIICSSSWANRSGGSIFSFLYYVIIWGKCLLDVQISELISCLHDRHHISNQAIFLFFFKKKKYMLWWFQVKDFWPRYWGGVVLSDRSKEFFKALGGGKLLKGKFISGFLFNPRAIANYKRAKTIAVDQNFRGAGEIKGGLFIVGRGKSGIAYQFIERNFGDWAPLDEVIEICTRLQVVISWLV